MLPPAPPITAAVRNLRLQSCSRSNRRSATAPYYSTAPRIQNISDSEATAQGVTASITLTQSTPAAGRWGLVAAPRGPCVGVSSPCALRRRDDRVLNGLGHLHTQGERADQHLSKMSIAVFCEIASFFRLVRKPRA